MKNLKKQFEKYPKVILTLAFVLSLSMVAISCNKDDDPQPQTKNKIMEVVDMP